MTEGKQKHYIFITTPIFNQRLEAVGSVIVWLCAHETHHFNTVPGEEIDLTAEGDMIPQKYIAIE